MDVDADSMAADRKAHFQTHVSPPTPATELAGWLDESFALAIQDGVRKAEREEAPPDVVKALSDTSIKTIIVSPITRVTAEGDPFGHHNGPFTIHLRHSCTEGTPIYVFTRPESPLAGWELVNPKLYITRANWVEIPNAAHLSSWFVTTLEMIAGFGIDAAGSDAIMKAVTDFTGADGWHVAGWLFACHFILKLTAKYCEIHTAGGPDAGAVHQVVPVPPQPRGVVVIFHFYRHFLRNDPDAVQFRVVGIADGDPRDRPPSGYSGLGFTDHHVCCVPVTHYFHTMYPIFLKVPGQRRLEFWVGPTYAARHSISPQSVILNRALPQARAHGQHNVRTENTNIRGVAEQNSHTVTLVV